MPSRSAGAGQCTGQRERSRPRGLSGRSLARVLKLVSGAPSTAATRVRGDPPPGAFLAEHRGCGELDDGAGNGYVRIACSCGAQIVYPVSEPPKASAATSYGPGGCPFGLYSLPLTSFGFRRATDSSCQSM
jgi:hypothetical protein